ncbi:Pentatricopeptide repeat-containing protein [Raphanus sativus]|uniref:Pentatricopeptide repeat-containing protein At1g10270-like n=1 Tax=Raphanus sativus TaxID=3726 RepID=A0A6J0N468_RAPSA|nr:pentatricopeptide repeat-containing protein At1g10270-like [Raphanus sativus]KAJ4900034.1 Pentatricopeptide repeat-containing protein [Raphanus sativus]
MSSSRSFFQRMMHSPKTKPYPIGRDHSRKQLPDCTKIRCPSSMLDHRVHFLINEVSDLDSAANHARLAVRKRMNPEKALFTCNAIISAMFAAGRSGDAFDLFDFFFNESKMKPDIAACNLIIKSHCEEGRLDNALGLYNHLLRHPPSPNHKTYDLLTEALVDAGMMDQALELLLRGRAELFNFQQPSMYMNLIRGFLQQGNLDMAYQLRDDFKTCSIRNRITILNSVFVEYLFKQGNDEKAMELYRTSLNNNGFTANGHVGHPYLKVLLKYGKKTQAWALFDYMLDNFDECIGLGNETLNMMMDECIKEGRFSDALNILAKSKAKSKYLHVGAYRNLITNFCLNGRLSEAESVFDEWLKQEGTKPDDATYTSLIHAYIKAERVEDAIETVNKLMAAKLHKVTNMFL